MPKPADYLKKLGFNLPPEAPQVTPEEQDAWAGTQPPLKPWQQRADASLAGLVGAFKGATGLGDQGEAGPTWTNGAALAMSALPLGEGVSGIKGMYSRLNRAIEARMPAMAHPSKVASIIKNFATPEEAEMRSLSTLLKGKGNSQVAKEEVVSHLAQNPVELQVNELKARPEGAVDVDHAHFGNPSEPKYSNYQVPGGENYKETLISSPPKPFEMGNDADYQDWHYKKYASHAPTHIDESDVNTYKSYVDDRGGPPEFHSSHWDDPNVLAHVRSNDRSLAAPSYQEAWKADPRLQEINQQIEGGRIGGLGQLSDEKDALMAEIEGRPEFQGQKGRYIEEVQSDWHQRGKEEGYQSTDPRPTAMDVDRAYSDFGNALHDPNTPEGPQGQVHPQVEALHQRWDDLRRRYEDGGKGVPDAPFKETWPDLALKQQVLDTAGDPSLSWIGHTTGDTQNTRYGLSKQISKVHFSPNGDLEAWDLNGNQVISQNIDRSELPRFIGHDAALRLTGGENAERLEAGIHAELAGENLDSGGEGMRTFYDKKLPSALSRILKPFGGKVELGEIPGPAPKFSFDAPSKRVGLDPVTRPYGGYEGRVYSRERAGGHPATESEHIASTWPLIEPDGEQSLVARADYKDPQRVAGKNADDLAFSMAKQPIFNKGIPAWIARLSPEMKAEIMKKGLPLLSLLGLFQPEAQDPSSSPLSGLKEAN